MKSYRLKNELKKAGADKRELEELMALADKLDGIKIPHLRSHVKEEIAEQIGFKTRKFHFHKSFALAGSLAAVAIVIIFSQNATPSSPFYEVKKITNFFHSTPVQPKYPAPALPQNQEHMHTIVPLQQLPTVSQTQPAPSNGDGSLRNEPAPNHRHMYIPMTDQRNVGQPRENNDQDTNPGLFKELFESF